VADVLVGLWVEDGTVPALGLEVTRTAAGVAAALGGRLTALTLGAGALGASDALHLAGAAQVLRCSCPLLARSPGEAGLRALEAAAALVRPGAVLLAADGLGRDWAPRLAWRLGAVMVGEVVRWRCEAGRITFERSVYGGKAVAAFRPATESVVATLRPGAAGPGGAVPAAPAGTDAELELPLAAGAGWPVLLRREREEREGPALEEARVVVAGGRGLGGREGFASLLELARALGGAVGSSRAAVDEGWAPPSWQIGQTGKSVAPDLYVAVGISGASQHLVGCGRAKTIVAINQDPEAPIFDHAHLGLVGDYREIVPHLTAALREGRD